MIGFKWCIFQRTFFVVVVVSSDALCHGDASIAASSTSSSSFRFIHHFDFGFVVCSHYAQPYNY